MEVNCCVCNKIINLQPYRLKRSKKFFCSKECILYKYKFCSCCKKEINREIDKQSKSLCRYCYNLNYIKDNPEKQEIWQKLNREKQRIKYGIPLDAPLLKNPKGTGQFCRGYKRKVVRNHPNCDKKGRVCEHHLIMENYLKRPLFKGENVHHINGIRDDNRIENLELWHKGQPAGQRVKDRILYYKDFIESYGGKVDLSTVTQI